METLKRRHRVVLVLGGARSGKSSYAQKMAEKRWRRPVYLATAEVQDEEMAERIKKHREQRGSRWRCIEEPLALASVLADHNLACDGLLVDCLTLWLSNVLLKEGPEKFQAHKTELIEALHRRTHDVILVSNEVGMGIVPENELGRTFRDQAGLLNQAVAVEADVVVFIAAGLPLTLKGQV